VVALPGPPGSGHPDFTDPATHGPAFLAAQGGGRPLRCAGYRGAAVTAPAAGAPAGRTPAPT
jgi:hypothetical protein